MKYLDNLLVVGAFGLSTTIGATLFATFAAWTYGELGQGERDVIAAATQPLSMGAGVGTAGRNASHRGVAEKVVRFAPITVIGHRRDADDDVVAQARASAATEKVVRFEPITVVGHRHDAKDVAVAQERAPVLN